MKRPEGIVLAIALSALTTHLGAYAETNQAKGGWVITQYNVKPATLPEVTTNKTHTARPLIISAVRPVDTERDLEKGRISVEGKVSSILQNETITFAPKIWIEAFDGTKTNAFEHSFFSDDPEYKRVAPGTNGHFLCATSLLDDGNGVTSVKYKGKGIILIYATTELKSGPDNRISNLIRMEVDFDTKKARIIDVQP